MCHSPTTDNPFYSKFHVNIDWQKEYTLTHSWWETVCHFSEFQRSREDRSGDGADLIVVDSAPAPAAQTAEGAFSFHNCDFLMFWDYAVAPPTTTLWECVYYRSIPVFFENSLSFKQRNILLFTKIIPYPLRGILIALKIGAFFFGFIFPPLTEGRCLKTI